MSANDGAERAAVCPRCQQPFTARGAQLRCRPCMLALVGLPATFEPATLGAPRSAVDLKASRSAFLAAQRQKARGVVA